MKPHIAKMPGGRWGVWRSRESRFYVDVYGRTMKCQRWPAAHGPDLRAALKLALVVADDNMRNQ